MKRWTRANSRRMLLAVAVSAVMGNIASTTELAPPQRVVSINLCTDFMAMRIAAPGQLVSVSRLSHDPKISPDPSTASHFPANAGLAEEVLQYRPDLVLAGYFTTRETTALLRQLGFHVETFFPANSFEDIRNQLRRIGKLFGQEHRAEAEVAQFDAVLSEVRKTGDENEPRPLAITYGPNGFSEAGGTLGGEILEAAGFENLATRLGYEGYTYVPLEKLIAGKPKFVVTGRPPSAPSRAHELLDHPALAEIRFARIVTTDTYWTCGGPFTSLAVQELSQQRTSLIRNVSN